MVVTYHPGEGPYHDICTSVRERAQAEGAIVIALETGHIICAVQVPTHLLKKAARMLRGIADDLENPDRLVNEEEPS